MIEQPQRRQGALDILVQFKSGEHKQRCLYPEDAVSVLRELAFRLASSSEIISVSITKADPVTRLLEGRA